MKQVYLTFILLISAVISMSAQNFYFEMGGGSGKSSTEYGLGTESREEYFGWNSTYLYTSSSTGIPLTKSGIGHDLGAKVGFGDMFGMPFYLVGEISWTNGNTWTVSQDYSYSYISPEYGTEFESEKEETNISINHLFFGPGFLFYPTNNFQVGASIGLVNSSVEVDVFNEYIYQSSYDDTYKESMSMSEKESGLGFGFNLSAAIDIGQVSGFLIGGKFSYINNEISIELPDMKLNLDVSATYVGLFLKYRFRGYPS